MAREGRRLYQRKYYYEHKEQFKTYRRRYYLKRKEREKSYQQKYNQQMRIEVLGYYSNGTFKCANCGEADIIVLCIDHINGGGTQHRAEIGCWGSHFYRWLKQQGFPKGYQVLCCNCNQRKRFQRKEYKDKGAL